MVNLYQQLICKLYSSPLYNTIMNGLVYNRRRYYGGTDRSLSDVHLDYRDFVLWVIIIASFVWLVISKHFTKKVRYIVTAIPAVFAVALFPFVISHYKDILIVAALSVVGVFLYEKFKDNDLDYEGTYISFVATDYIFTTGIITATAELLIIMA